MGSPASYESYNIVGVKTKNTADKRRNADGFINSINARLIRSPIIEEVILPQNFCRGERRLRYTEKRTLRKEDVNYYLRSFLKNFGSRLYSI